MIVSKLIHNLLEPQEDAPPSSNFTSLECKRKNLASFSMIAEPLFVHYLRNCDYLLA